MSTTDYCTLDEVKESVRTEKATNDARLRRAISAASRQVDGWCKRRFYRDTDAAGADVVSARVFWPESDRRTVKVDDFATTTGLLVKSDAGDDGTYETSYASTVYQVYPLNALVAGLPWAYTRICLERGNYFPRWVSNPPVQITACWGWPSVPDAVKQATIVQAVRLWKGEEAPFGVLEVADVTVARLPAMHPEVRALLTPFMRDQVLVA